MGPIDGEPNPVAVFVYVGMAFMLVIVWFLVLATSVYRYTLATKESGDKAAKPVMVLWVVSQLFLFTGPCVFLLAFGSLVGGIVHLRKRGADNAPTRIAAIATIVHSSVLLLFGFASAVVLGIGGYFG